MLAWEARSFSLGSSSSLEPSSIEKENKMTTFYYELYFDGDDINRFWGTEPTTLTDGSTQDLCGQLYYVRLDDEHMAAMGIDPSYGVQDNEEMFRVLSALYAPVSGDCDADLVNCVYPETAECLVGFREISDGDYYTAVGE